jgi:hypothetical protein
MTGAELQKFLDKHGMSQRGTALMLGMNERTMRNHVKAANVSRELEFAVRYVAGLSKAEREALRRGDK